MTAAVKTYMQPAFLICVALLAAGASGMSIMQRFFQMYLIKEPLPLKKPLDLLDQSDLGPYKILSQRKIENQDVIETLGTDQYIQWLLEDTELPPDSPVRKCTLFITYYERPDNVPHVPEECYTGGGYRKIASEKVTFKIERTDFVKEFGGMYVLFGGADPDNWQAGTEFVVLYFFRVNGIYAATRQQARIALNRNLFRRHSYFCKVEMAFMHSAAPPTRQQAVYAADKLLGVILPVLESEHWPQWQ